MAAYGSFGTEKPKALKFNPNLEDGVRLPGGLLIGLNSNNDYLK